MADPAGFEPVISSLTGTRVRPGYTTDPNKNLEFRINITEKNGKSKVGGW